MRCRKLITLSVFSLVLSTACQAQEGAEDEADPDPASPRAEMTADRLDELIRRIDEEALRDDNQWQFQVDERQMLVIIDENADRMRILTPIASAEAETLPEGLLYRLMQANFDSALDARYAIANGLIWGAFIHPLGSLGESEFFSAVGQVVNVADTFGTTYNSGVFIFGGGDSAEEQRRLLERLRELSEEPVI